jgi:hypothetical protein
MDNNVKTHLYIIGNGFDRYHGAASRYLDFHNYLFARNPEIVGAFDLYFGPRSIDRSFNFDLGGFWCVQPKSERNKYHLPYPATTWAKDHLWANFEYHLGDMNREKVFEDLDQYYPKKLRHAQKFTFHSYVTPIQSLSSRINECTFKMKYHFHRWINKLHYAKGWKNRMLALENDAMYLTFNYTTFLEDEYTIPASQICYIHGNRHDPFGSLVLGHRANIAQDFEKWKYLRRNRRHYRPNLKDEKGRYYANDNMEYLAYFLSDEQKGNWHNVFRYNAVLEAREILEKYYDANMKDTSRIIDQHRPFFQSLKDIKKITVLGHSLSAVDMPYFATIKEQIPNYVDWDFSVYGQRDEQMVKQFCKQMNIHRDHCHMFNIAALIRSTQP